MSDAFDVLNAARNQKTVNSSFNTGTAKKGGRPPKSANEKRNNKITVYFSNYELSAINNYCESIGVQPAVFLRTQVMHKVKKKD